MTNTFRAGSQTGKLGAFTDEQEAQKVADVCAAGRPDPYAGHSPGPWALCYDGQIDDAEGCTVCRFPLASYNEFRQLHYAPTARLIADAPKLLQELASARAHINELREAVMLLANGMEHVAKLFPELVSGMPGLQWMPEKARAALAATNPADPAKGRG